MIRRLQDWAAAQADLRPEAAAVVMAGQRVSYGGLESASNRLARMLAAMGCAPGDRVCFLLPKSIDAIVAIHGILKAGCLYVPLDAESPAARLAKIVGACRPRVILCAGASLGLLGTLSSLCAPAAAARVGVMASDRPDCPGLEVAFTLADVEALPTTSPRLAGAPDGPAHILFTSGSTGTPKGVVITHANVIAFVDWARGHFGILPSDRVSGHSPLHFDLSTFDIFGALSAGAELHLVPARLNLLPNKLAAFIRDSLLTQWFSVPSVLTFMAKLDVVEAGDFPAMKRLMWCGETFPTPSLIHWMRRLPHVRFTNLYGPTEATIASSCYDMPACPQEASAAIPIGTACGGEALLVLDQAMRPAPRGRAGDLYIGGAGLSPGYWEDPEKTAQVFLRYRQGPDGAARIYRTGDRASLGEDGLVYFHGRADTQIKSRGYRVELGEIEAALNTLNCLRECAVVARHGGGFEGATICCAYAPANGREVTPGALRKALGQQLPSYMLPAHWAALEQLPKNANGKIDRRRLTEAFERDAGETA